MLKYVKLFQLNLTLKQKSSINIAIKHLCALKMYILDCLGLCDFLDCFFFFSFCLTVEVYLSHLFREDLHSWWLAKYLFALLHVLNFLFFKVCP